LPIALLTVLLTGLVTIAGCGGKPADSGGVGDIPDNQAFVEYRPPAGRYAVKIPEGWARMEAGDTATFTDKLNTITVTAMPRATAPDLTAGHADLDALRATAKGFTPGDVTTVHRTAGNAVRLTYRADAEPDPVTGKVVNDDVERYAFWHDGLLVTLTLAGPHGADNVDPWRTVTDSLRWLP
jgi:hypothetical protein